MFSKSDGLQVNSGRSLAIAVAAIIASNARALDFRPARRRDAATRPKDRAAAASNGSGWKSASACWRRSCRIACSRGSDATSGPTESSASVTAVIIGTSGSVETSAILSKRTMVLVSRTPRTMGINAITKSGQELSPRHDEGIQDPSAATMPTDPPVPVMTTEADPVAEAARLACRLASLSGAHPRQHDRRPCRHDFVVRG